MQDEGDRHHAVRPEIKRIAERRPDPAVGAFRHGLEINSEKLENAVQCGQGSTQDDRPGHFPRQAAAVELHRQPVKKSTAEDGEPPEHITAVLDRKSVV